MDAVIFMDAVICGKSAHKALADRIGLPLLASPHTRHSLASPGKPIDEGCSASAGIKAEAKQLHETSVAEREASTETLKETSARREALRETSVEERYKRCEYRDATRDVSAETLQET